jgi:hypothetical protein
VKTLAITSHGDHRTRKFMARHMWQCHIGVCSTPAMMVRAADAASLDLQDNAIYRTIRVRHIADLQRTSVSFEYCGFHKQKLPRLGDKAKYG